MFKVISLLICSLVVSSAALCQEPQRSFQIAVIDTDKGSITVKLYNKTPVHRDNFIKLIKQRYFDNQLFHRVIKNFMIQGGDPHSVNAARGQRLGSAGPGYTLPAEFHPELFHKKGALAAARRGDEANPEKRSSGSQFYIIQGRTFTVEELEVMEQKGLHEPFTSIQIERYTTVGGTPHLDGDYTVFGEVIEGLDVVDRIASVETDDYDRPLRDIKYSVRLLE